MDRQKTLIGSLQYWLLLALFVGDLRVLTRLGLRIKHMRTQGQWSWDSSLRHHLQARASQLQEPLRTISYGERVIPLIDLLVWLRLRRRQPGAACFFGLALSGVALLRWLSKVMVHRPRPLFERRAGEKSSYPSGHAADSMALVLTLATVAQQSHARTAIHLIGTPIAFVIGLSRIARNRHYPSDVLAGWGLALVWVQQLRAVLRPSSRVQNERHLAVTIRE
jgi:membrane-associated phospholipid phosphatase